MTIREIQEYIRQRKLEVVNSPKRGDSDKLRNSGAYDELVNFDLWLNNNLKK